VLEATHRAGAIMKVIFENCYLQDKHKIQLCGICAGLGVDFAKTPAGYGSGGATLQEWKRRLAIPMGAEPALAPVGRI
jgi:deoxyribose-phosphate aldolase